VNTTCTTSYTGYPLYYSVVVPALSSIVVTATPDGSASSLNPSIQVMNSCAASAACVAYGNDAGAGAAEVLAFGNPTQSNVTYVVSVQGVSTASGSGGFTLTAAAGPPVAANGACSAPIALTPGVAVTGQNAAQASGTSNQCTTSFPGKALYYSLVLPPRIAATVNVTPTGSGNTFNPTLRVAESCDVAAVCTVSQNGGAVGAVESATFSNATSVEKTFVITVSGSSASNAAGPFDIVATTEPIIENAICSGAIDLGTGGSAVGQNLTRGGDAFAGASCVTTTSKVLWFKSTVAAGRALAIRAQPHIAANSPTASWDAVVRVVTACDATTCSAGSSNNVTSTSFALEPVVYANTTASDQVVYFNVAATVPAAAGRFDVETLTLPWPQATIPDCASAPAITTSTVVYGTTSDSTQFRTSSGCSNLSAAANGVQYHRVTVPAGQRLAAMMYPLTAFNGHIRLYDATAAVNSCDASAACVASSDKTSTTGGSESFVWTNTTAEPRTVALLVGSNSSTTKGPYAVRIDIGVPRYTVTTDTSVACENTAGAQLVALRDPTSNDSTTSGEPLPFAFSYFARPARAVVIGTDGYLSLFAHTSPWFTASTNTYGNVAMPFAQVPNGVIAPLWDDMTWTSAAPMPVKAFTVGTAPNRRFVVAWDGIRAFSGAAPQVLNFQTHLVETTNRVEFHYCSIVAGSGTTHDGSGATIGIEDFDGMDAHVVSFNTAVAGGLHGKRIVFAPTP